MMTIHLCQSSEKLNWNQIKQSILGRQRLADKFTCAGCSRSFETICCLHFHCMKHNEGGSYYFDHVTSTAFPKLDTRCSATQFEAEDFNDDGRHKLKVLVGNVTSLKPLTSRCLNKENNTNVEEIDGSVKNISNENGTCVSDGDTTTNQEVEVTSGNILDEGTKEGETDARIEEEKREGFARVKVRNIERREDGSISFEMNEADAHLFQATANTLIEQMRKKAGDLPIPAQELEVMVPDDSLQVEHSKVSEDSELTDKQAAIDPVSIQEKDRSTTVSDVQEDQDTDTLVEYEINQDRDVNSKTTVDIEKGKVKDNSSDIDRRKNEIVKRSSQRKILGKGNDLVEMKMDSTDDIRFKSNRKLCNKKKERNVDDASPDKDIEKIGTKTGGKNSELVDKKQNNNFVLEYPVYTRSQRKRKLTTRMKESELPEMLKLTGRTPQLQETKNEELTLKRRKSLIGETDFNAGETLLALRETRDLKSMKSSNRKTGLSTFSKDKDKYYNEEVDFNADKTSDHEVTPNEDSDADKIDGAIVINDLRKGNGNDGSGILTAHSVCNEEEEEEIDDEICDGKEEDLEKTIKRVYPKKQRRKRLKKGQMPLKRRNDFKCNECGKVGSLSMIKYHEQMHSDKMPYKCEDCGKCFKTSACKRSHMLQHGEKKWKCEQCPAAFYRKQYLDVHMTNHTGEYPYVCELCGMKFKMAYIVRRHVNNVHKNIRNYKCDICDKEFFRVATRDQHRNRHFDPFLQCSYCPKKFKGDLDLRKHELTHTGEKMYFCPICNQGFTQIWPYYKHMWKIHNIEKEEAKKMKIRNPDIVNMRNVNKDSVNKEQAYVHEFIGKPGCTFDMRKTFNQNVNQLKFIENKLGSHQSGNNEDGKQICETSIQNEGNAVYTATEADVADTIVMNIGGDLDNRETIVIQTEELQSIGNQQTGYIVVENSHGEDNIVIYSGMPQNEAADVHQFIGNC